METKIYRVRKDTKSIDFISALQVMRTQDAVFLIGKDLCKIEKMVYDRKFKDQLQVFDNNNWRKSNCDLDFVINKECYLCEEIPEPEYELTPEAMAGFWVNKTNGVIERNDCWHLDSELVINFVAHHRPATAEDLQNYCDKFNGKVK